MHPLARVLMSLPKRVLEQGTQTERNAWIHIARFIPDLVDRESSFDPQGQPVRNIQPRTSTGRVQAAGAIAVFKIVDFSRIGNRVKLSPSDKSAVAVQHFGTQFRRTTNERRVRKECV